jgi:hypothetical protein
MPKTSSGKVQRKLCRLQFLEGSLKAVGGWLGGPGSIRIETHWACGARGRVADQKEAVR